MTANYVKCHEIKVWCPFTNFRGISPGFSNTVSLGLVFLSTMFSVIIHEVPGKILSLGPWLYFSQPHPKSTSHNSYLFFF